ncbi:hypothetical protein H5410_016281 [Solanum commersonii]|uniref:Uncharacterized protein n=1 Tax=Solanum commersonii TaxID=4109 RepID=A0A9J5ZW11_SOLCO|nr:hypothetical protein H5410_016281 [Solanum commersonii]
MGRVKEALDHFSSATRLVVNMKKPSIFIVGVILHQKQLSPTDGITKEDEDYKLNKDISSSIKAQSNNVASRIREIANQRENDKLHIRMDGPCCCLCDNTDYGDKLLFIY